MDNSNEKIRRISAEIESALDLKNPFSNKFIRAALESIKIFDDKHTEKGVASYGDFGPVGVAVKLSDKWDLLKEHYITGEVYPSEVIEELWQDISVYGLIGKLVEEGEWK